MAKEADLRVTKTRRALIVAMLALLEKKSFAKISVNDICQEALVSRSTFYVHFEDKYMLLRSCLKEIKRCLFENLQKQDFEAHLTSILTNIQQQSKVFHHLFVTDVNEEMMAMFRDFYINDARKYLESQERAGCALPEPVELLAVFLGGGVAATLKWWIEQDFPVSAAELAASQSRLLSSVFNIKYT